MDVTAAPLRAEPKGIEPTGAGLSFGQALFWLPQHAPAFVPASRSLSALPFMFWLMETLRPRLAVQRGLGDGVLYLGLCEAAARLGLGLRAAGLDTPVSAALRGQHDAAYGAFSTLSDARTTSLPQILAETGAEMGAEVDLLILSAVPEASAAAGLAQDALPRLSERGVLLLCDPERLFQSVDARQAVLRGAGFADAGRSLQLGPWAPEGPVFEMILGPAAPAALAQLAGSEAGSEGEGLRAAFARLGQALVNHAALERLRAERAAMQAAEAAAFADLGALQAQLHDRDQLASAARRDGAKLAALEQAFAELRRSYATRIDDIAALTGQFTQELAGLEQSHKAQTEAALQERARLAAKLKAMTKERDQLASKLKSMVKSLSWRVTKPLRKVRQVLRR